MIPPFFKINSKQEISKNTFNQKSKFELNNFYDSVIKQKF